MKKRRIVYTALSLVLLSTLMLTGTTSNAQADNPNPPANPVKLVFIHHSTGGNWLADPNSDQPYGGLGIALRDNNYFVSATNYGWGPGSIGDRTDIVNWPEWFTSPQSSTYLSALYNESGQNIGDFGAWSRLGGTLAGENEIVMFKSCFPNSDLYGNPNDPPLAQWNDWEYSVANAKAIYNHLLTTFQTRQDKLFVVITAPPLMRSETAADRAANARAFNNWLVDEWLKDYPFHNVAVFDYFNVLTAAGNHHRWNNGRIEHVQSVDSNFAAYPSGDSHPNTEGHSKATAEFVPLLNVIYNRWKSAPVEAPTSTPAQEVLPAVTPTPAKAAQPTPTSQDATPTPQTVASITPASLIDDWEGENGWESYGDGMQSTVVSEVDVSQAHGGGASLRIEYNVTAEGWGDTGTSFDGVQDWSEGSGLSFWLHADTPGYLAHLVLFAGNTEAPTPFEVEFVTSDAHIAGWQEVILPWEAFALAPWDDGTGLKTLDPARIVGVAFNFTPGKGTLWVDDLGLFSGSLQPPPSQPTAIPNPDQPAPTATAVSEPDVPTPTAIQPSADPGEQAPPKGGLCTSPALLISVAVLLVWLRRQ